MGRIKTALITGVITSLLVLPSFATNLNEKKTNYQIRCGGFRVGEAHYNTKEDDKNYNIELTGHPTGFFKFLGLEYKFSTEGYKKDGHLYPEKFKRVNKSGVSEDRTSCEVSEVTDITFDYESLEARAYAYKETQNGITVKYDTRNDPKKITLDTKDFLTIAEELKKGDLKEYYEINLLAKGKPHPFRITKVGEEWISINGEYYNTAVYETEVTADMFGIDSKAKIWVDKDEGHTLLKWWIENGPLWTSITLVYTGKKSDLKS